MSNVLLRLAHRGELRSIVLRINELRAEIAYIEQILAQETSRGAAADLRTQQFRIELSRAAVDERQAELDVLLAREAAILGRPTPFSPQHSDQPPSAAETPAPRSSELPVTRAHSAADPDRIAPDRSIPSPTTGPSHETGYGEAQDTGRATGTAPIPGRRFGVRTAGLGERLAAAAAATNRVADSTVVDSPTLEGTGTVADATGPNRFGRIGAAPAQIRAAEDTPSQAGPHVGRTLPRRQMAPGEKARWLLARARMLPVRVVAFAAASVLFLNAAADLAIVRIPLAPAQAQKAEATRSQVPTGLGVNPVPVGDPRQQVSLPSGSWRTRTDALRGQTLQVCKNGARFDLSVAFASDAGGDYVVILADMTNNGTAAQNVFLTTQLRDNSGRVYDMADPRASDFYDSTLARFESSYVQDNAQEIQPDQSHRVLLLFQVAPDSTGLQLVPDNWSCR